MIRYSVTSTWRHGLNNTHFPYCLVKDLVIMSCTDLVNNENVPGKFRVANWINFGVDFVLRARLS